MKIKYLKIQHVVGMISVFSDNSLIKQFIYENKDDRTIAINDANTCIVDTVEKGVEPL